MIQKFRPYLLYLVLFAVFSMLLVACGGGLTDDEILDVIYEPFWVYGETGNWSVISKGECDEISATAKARGIEEAWIVEYSFEVYNDAFSRWDTNNTNTLVVKKNGQWEDYGTPICP